MNYNKTFLGAHSDFHCGTDAIQQAIARALKAEGLPNIAQSVYRVHAPTERDSIEIHLKGNGRRVIATFTHEEVLEAATRIDALSGPVRIIAARILNRPLTRLPAITADRAAFSSWVRRFSK